MRFPLLLCFVFCAGVVVCVFWLLFGGCGFVVLFVVWFLGGVLGVSFFAVCYTVIVSFKGKEKIKMMVSDMTLEEKNELLATLWDDLSVTLHGVKDGVTSSIDRDQAVDDDGVAVYDSYQFLMPYESDDGLLLFSAEDLEAFACTW